VVIYLEGEAGMALKETFPELLELLIRDGELNPDYRVLIDGRNVVFLGGLEAEVRDGSRVVVFPPAGGG